jgi:hypothetical protein
MGVLNERRCKNNEKKLQNFFGKSKNGQKKCPFFKS